MKQDVKRPIAVANNHPAIRISLGKRRSRQKQDLPTFTLRSSLQGNLSTVMAELKLLRTAAAAGSTQLVAQCGPLSMTAPGAGSVEVFH